MVGRFLNGSLGATPWAVAVLCACGTPPAAETPPAPPAPTTLKPGRAGRAPATSGAKPEAGAASRADTPPCPEDMAHVHHDYCPNMERQCDKSEYDKPNRLTICHRFRAGTNRCTAARMPLSFCIDRYEYPNQAGARPPVMVDFYDAMGLCAARGKRLCYESEWTAACEGPSELPFPYGWERSSAACNIDNAWISPSLEKIYSRKASVRDAELARLDRGLPSGSKPDCVSGYGVYDLTGNFDEWTLADQDRKATKGVFAALKGGAWGHVRNACRPVTTSHEPEFSYYFVSFRCCRDIHADTRNKAEQSARNSDSSAR